MYVQHPTGILYSNRETSEIDFLVSPSTARSLMDMFFSFQEAWHLMELKSDTADFPKISLVSKDNNGSKVHLNVKMHADWYASVIHNFSSACAADAAAGRCYQIINN